MLESLVNFKEISERPHVAFFWGFIISTVAIITSAKIAFSIYFSGTMVNLGGIFAVLFTIIPSAFFVTLLIKKEEMLEEDFIKKHYEKKFWERHETDLLIFLFYFAGITLSFAIWALIIPITIPFFGIKIPDTFFTVQYDSVCTFHYELDICQKYRIGHVCHYNPELCQSYGVSGAVTGNVLSFGKVLGNNLGVMAFAFLFSFLFGAGAVFIIAWNASVLGVLIGHLSKELWYGLPIVGLKFLPHGIPEIAGYICAALAGGLISAAIIRMLRIGKINTGILNTVIIDALKILIFGIILLIIGAGIEVYL